MKNNPLNDLYKQFKENIISRTKFESLIFIYYLKNQGKTILSRWKPHEYEDFISWFYPRLKKAIDTYAYETASFDTYISRFLLISSREYKSREARNSIIEHSAWSARIPDLYVNEELPEYLRGFNNDSIYKADIINAKKKKNTRRLLALIIKCYNYISDDFIEKIAPLLDIKEEELKDMMEKIRRLRQKNDDELYIMKEKLYCQFYRCIALEKKLSLISDNAEEKTKLKNRLINSKQKLEKMRVKINSIKKEASNSQVAEVIGISKGSVDSGLHKLKEKYNLN